MYHPRLYGSHYDMGHQYGTLLAKKGFELPNTSAKAEAYGKESLEVVRQCFPEGYQEIAGFARGINANIQKVGGFLLSLGYEHPRGQCSLFACQQNGQVFIGRNYDMLFAFKKFTESSLIAPEGSYAYIGQSDVFIGKCDGINERGLFVGMAFVNGTTRQPGISFHMVVKYLLEKCATTKEAIQALEGLPHASANNYLLADATGYLSVVEAAPQQVAVRLPAHGHATIAATNQFILPKMASYDSGGVAWSLSAERYQALQSSHPQKMITSLDSVKEVLASPSVCLNLKKSKFGTIWSVAAELTKLDIHRCEGMPTLARFKPETRLAWWQKRPRRQLG